MALAAVVDYISWGVLCMLWNQEAFQAAFLSPRKKIKPAAWLQLSPSHATQLHFAFYTLSSQVRQTYMK